MTTGKTIALTRRTFVGKVMSLLLNMLSRLVITFRPRSKRLLISPMGDGLAFPHVRGVEGGGLTLALGVSKKGFVYDDAGSKVNFIFFSVIPVAVSAFYLRLMSGLTDAFTKEANRDLLMAAKTPTELWKALTRATRSTIQ